MKEVTETSTRRRQTRVRCSQKRPGSNAREWALYGADLVMVDTEETRRRILAAFLDPTGSRRLY